METTNKRQMDAMLDAMLEKYEWDDLVFMMVNRNHFQYFQATAKIPTWKEYIKDVDSIRRGLDTPTLYVLEVVESAMNEWETKSHRHIKNEMETPGGMVCIVCRHNQCARVRVEARRTLR